MKKTHRFIKPGLVLVCLAVFGPAHPVEAEIPKKVSQAFVRAGLPVLRRPSAAPDFSLPLTGEAKISLADLKGKAVFLNFWATWCGPCRAEMPSMEALYRRYRDRGLEILAVNVREDRETAAAFMDQFRLSFPAALDSGGVSRRYGITAFPTTYIIDREGLIISRIVGSIDWDTPEISAAFAALLE
ncbi:MAG: TlpA family protein disulfide reductase [Treponema sp.]|jgi:thiol-disulfide isomerase/thioredoxin|nr:TlpA family protein disulfide reductase [Treponema sp.]